MVLTKKKNADVAKQNNWLLKMLLGWQKYKHLHRPWLNNQVFLLLALLHLNQNL
jgi:hypothetical protein